MSNTEKVIDLALAAAALYLAFAWSTASGSFDLWQFIRAAIVFGGVALALWNLVPESSETALQAETRPRRLRWFWLGTALAIAALATPLPFGTNTVLNWHNLLQRLLSVQLL